MLSYPILGLFLILALVVIAILAWGSFNICSGLYIKAHCRGKGSGRKIALSFDDGPDPEITPQVLELLKKKHIKAGFFLVGEKVEHDPGLLEKIISDGHVVGNHSYSHKNNFGFKSKKKVLKELQKTEALIFHLSGKRLKLFRPPFGVTNPNIAGAARILEYAVVGWSIRSLDTMGKSRDKTIKRVNWRLKPGSLILFHDTHADILPILEAVIAHASGKGYEFVSPDLLFNIEPYK
jgi:peptidoglycan/xylan/chitin deacetylase (PgdA/CDA1 family)